MCRRKHLLWCPYWKWLSRKILTLFNTLLAVFPLGLGKGGISKSITSNLMKTLHCPEVLICFSSLFTFSLCLLTVLKLSCFPQPSHSFTSLLNLSFLESIKTTSKELAQLPVSDLALKSSFSCFLARRYSCFLTCLSLFLPLIRVPWCLCGFNLSLSTGFFPWHSHLKKAKPNTKLCLDLLNSNCYHVLLLSL